MTDTAETNSPTKQRNLDGFAHLLNRPQKTVEVVMAYHPSDSVEADRLRIEMLKKKRVHERDEDDVENALEFEAARDEIDEFLSEVEVMTFRFRSIGEHEYDALVNAWPATPQQLKEYRTRTGKKDAHLRWDAIEFPPRIIAACLQEITFSDGTETVDGLTLDQVREMVQSQRFTAGDISQLISAAEEVNLAASRIEDAGKG